MVEENKGQIEQSDLDKLRGPNSTLELLDLVKKYVRSYESELLACNETKYFMGYTNYEKECEHNIFVAGWGIQHWATSVDKEIVESTAIVPPQTRPELEERVSELIRLGKISDCIYLFSSRRASTGSCIPSNCGREHQWLIPKVLFGINKRTVLRYGNFYGHNEYDYKYYNVHNPMLRLIEEAVGEKGNKIENVAIPEQATQPIAAYTIPSEIKGASIVLALFNDPIAAISSLDGFPDIWNVALKFEPAFLSAVRPLTEEEYRPYALAREKLLEKVECERQRTYEHRLRGTYSAPLEKPTGQRLYEERYANQMRSAIEASGNFRGSEEQWMDRFPDNGEIPPWIWWEIYQRSRGRRV